MLNKKIIFIFDSGKKVGAGHFGRCFSLSEALGIKYKKSNFYFLSCNNSFKKEIIKNNSNFFLLKSYSSPYLINFIKKINPAIIIIDSYQIPFNSEKTLFKNFKKTIIIEDNISKKRQGLIYINYNFKEKEDIVKIKKFINFKKIFFGPEYFISNNSYKKEIKINEESKIKNVLIYFGASKNSFLLKKLLDILKKEFFKNFSFVIIIGKYDFYNYSLKYRDKNFNFVKTLNNKSFLNIASKCQISIGSGGVSCWERIKLGLFNLVIITANNQIKSVKSLSRRRYIYSLGSLKKLNFNNLEIKLRKLFLDTKLINNARIRSKGLLIKNKVKLIKQYLKI